MDKLADGVIAVALAVVGIAMAAVIFGKNSKTADVVKQGGSSFAEIIKAAVGPVM